MSLSHSPSIVRDGLVAYYDAANQKSYSTNIFPNPLDIYTWYTTTKGNATANNCTVAQDLVTSKSPANGIPMKMSVTANDPHTASFGAMLWNLSTSKAGDVWTISCWVKASVVTTSEFYIFGANSLGTWITAPNKTLTITTEWVWHEFTTTFSNALIEYVQIRLDGTNASGAGIDIWWDGLQLQRTSAATTLITTPNIGGNTFKDISGGAPNFTLYNSKYITNYSNYIQFTRAASAPKHGGVAQLIGTGELTSANFIYSDHTWEVLFRIDDINPGSYDATEGNSIICAFSGYHVGFMYTSTLLRYFMFDAVGLTGVNACSWSLGTSGAQINQDSWYNVTVVRNGDTFIPYINGAPFGTGSTRAYTAYNGVSNNIWLGGTVNTTEGLGSYVYYGKNSVSNMKMYNRALTASEVLQNFNAIKGRFSL